MQSGVYRHFSAQAFPDSVSGETVKTCMPKRCEGFLVKANGMSPAVLAQLPSFDRGHLSARTRIDVKGEDGI